MKAGDAVRPFLIGIVGAAVGATAVVNIDAQPGRPLAAVAAYAGSEDDQQRIIEAVKHAEPSVVALDVRVNGTRVVPSDPFAGFFGSGFNGGGARLLPYHEAASGSGFVFSTSGLIVTNDHVVHGASKIDVVFANGDRIPGHIYSENAAADLALVKVDGYRKLPPPLTFGTSRGVEQGEWAIAIGEPFALKQTVTVGVVSGFNRDETIGGEATGPREFKGLLQTSAPINPGNSGGPLIDLDGHVIGVNQSVAQPAQNIGFAIPIDTVKSDAALLEAHPGSMTTGAEGFLGVQLTPLDSDVRSQLNYVGQGAAVLSVIGGSPADRAGLEPGDIIQSVDGTSVHTPSDVSSIVQKLAPGKTASLGVWSNGKRETVAVTVGTAPDQSG